MSGSLTGLDQLEEAFVQEGVEVGPYRDMIARVQRHFHRYAGLENELLGQVSFPILLDVSRPVTEEVTPLEIEELAATQRRRFQSDDLVTGDLMTTLDRDGLKVYCPPFPPGPINGFFLFDARVGPVMVVEAGVSVSEANVVFARLLGHYLIDNNPYHICLTRRSGQEKTAAAEFGLAFLIGAQMLKGYLAALGERGPGEPQTIRQLATYFETTPALVIERLTGLGYLDAGTAASLADMAETPVAPEDDQAGVSERFTRLALEANARGNLTLQELSEHLEADEQVAQGLVDRFRLDDPDEVESG